MIIRYSEKSPRFLQNLIFVESTKPEYLLPEIS